MALSRGLVWVPSSTAQFLLVGQDYSSWAQWAGSMGGGGWMDYASITSTKGLMEQLRFTGPVELQ